MKAANPPPILDELQYRESIKGRRFTIFGLTSQKGKILNGKTGTYEGVQYEPSMRTLIKIKEDNTIYKIQPRNLVPEGYTLKTIHAPYEVMTLAQEQTIDKLIGAAQKSTNQGTQWKLCFKYVGPQTNYCFYCHQFGTACYDYCGYCGADYLRLLHVQSNKLMIFYKRCSCCQQRCTDLDLAGRCQNGWNRIYKNPEKNWISYDTSKQND